MQANARLHESFFSEKEFKGSSDRDFGLIFAVAFAIVGLGRDLKEHEPRLWAISVAAIRIFFATAGRAIARPL